MEVFIFFFTFGVLLIGNFQKAIIRNPITTFVMLFAKQNCSNRKMTSTTRYCFGTWRVLMNTGILNVPTVNHGNLEEVTLSGFGLRANFKKVLQVKSICSPVVTSLIGALLFGVIWSISCQNIILGYLLHCIVTALKLLETERAFLTRLIVGLSIFRFQNLTVQFYSCLNKMRKYYMKLWKKSQ